jgi:hypothetical protein
LLAEFNVTEQLWRGRRKNWSFRLSVPVIVHPIVGL